MIHNLFILDSRNEIVAQKQFWTIRVNPKEMPYFAARVRDSQEVIIEEIGPVKYVGKPVGRYVAVLCAEAVDDDDTLRDKAERVAYEFRRVVNHEVQRRTFMKKVDDYVTTTLKVSVIGYGGVGKEEIVTLLNGGIPPTSYVPTISIDIQKIQGVRIGTYEVSTWDFAGQERFRKLWELYFRGSRIILIVTDSTLENVLNSKDFVDQIRRMEIEDTHFRPEILAIANKQDLPGALSPALVSRILGVKAYGLNSMNPTDPVNRQKALVIIKEALTAGTRLAGPTEVALPQRLAPSSEPPPAVARAPDHKFREPLIVNGEEPTARKRTSKRPRRTVGEEDEGRDRILDGIARSLAEHGEATDAVRSASAIGNEHRRLQSLAVVAEALALARRIPEAVETTRILRDPDRASRVLSSAIGTLVKENRLDEAIELLKHIQAANRPPKALGEVCAALARSHKIPKALELFGQVTNEDHRTVVLAPLIGALVEEGKAPMALKLIAKIENRDARALFFRKYRREIEACATLPERAFKGSDNFRQDLDDHVVTPQKICLVGQGGVGKSTILKLISSPSISSPHIPTIGVDIEKVKGVRVGPHEITALSFAGQDKFRSLWRYYLRNADAVLLVTDSTLKNVLETRDILAIVRRESPSATVRAIANKQDLPGALAPATVQRMLRVETYGLVATNPAYRDELCRILFDAGAEPAAPLQRIPPPLEPPEGILREPDYEVRDGRWVERKTRTKGKKGAEQ